MTRPFNWQDTPDTVVLGHLEYMALLYVPLISAYDDTPLDIPAALEALGRGEALIVDEQRSATYESARMALLRALALMARLPGGVSFGRVHFGNNEEWTITI